MLLLLMLMPYMGIARSMDPLLKDLLTPSLQMGESCGYDSCPVIKEGWKYIHLVPHSHAELGYMKTFYEHYTGFDDFYARSKINMKQVLDSVVTELWEHKERKFTLSSSELPYFFHWWSKRADVVHRMVYTLLRQGRLVFVGGGWGMVDEANSYYQSIIDSYGDSLRKLNSTFLACGRPLVAWQADVFGHSREHTSLVSQMGFDGLFVNPISFDDELIRMERKALEVVWRGSDDLGASTDIYTHKLFDGYWSPPGFCFSSMCSDPLLITSDSVFKNIDERVNVFLESVRYRQSPYYNTRHTLVVMGQRMGYFNARIWYENIDKLIKHANMKTYGSGLKTHVMYSNPACYLKAVREDDPVLETKQDDFLPFAYNKYTYASGLFTSRPTFKYFVRAANIYLQMAKQLNVLANLKNKEKILDELKWIVGVVQDHNVLSGAMRPYVVSYYTKELYSAIVKTMPLIGEAFNKLRKTASKTVYHMCSFNMSSCPHTIGNKFNIFIYNPLAWSVNISVRIPISNKEYEVFESKGSKIKAVIMKISDGILNIRNRQTTAHELVYVAKVPPMGLNSYNVIAKRRKRSLIKKLSKNQQKTYFLRQVANNKSIFDDDDDFDETTTDDKVDFGNINKEVVSIDDSATSRSVGTSSTIVVTSDVENTTTTTTVKNLIGKVSSNWIYERTEVDDVKEHKYHYEVSKDTFIKNQYIQINLDEYRKISTMNLSNGINITLDIQYYYYISDEPGENTTKIDPGATIFCANDSNPTPIIDFIDTKVYKSDIVEEIHCKYSNFASFVVKLYRDSPVLEVDWMVGPVPVEDGLGKEVFLRYTTDLLNNGVFYTDSNGRQTVKRIRNSRPMYEPYNLDPVAGNFYPVTTRIYVEDRNKNVRLSVFVDRAQGGASILEGTIDLMVLRRIFTEDNKIQAFLNETENGVGIRVRGTHYVYLTKSDCKQNRLFEKKFSKEIELKPRIFVAVNDRWTINDKTFTTLKTKLPFGVHVLSLEKTDDKSILLRLENYLEKDEVLKDGIKYVDLNEIFVNINLVSIVETTLGGHILKNDWTSLKWETKGAFVDNSNHFYGNNKSRRDKRRDINEGVPQGVTLGPQQIRTFIIEYVYLEDRL